MLTPRFKLRQDETSVYITIHAPFTNIKETEVDVDGENLLFVSSPYFLRLRLPGKIFHSDNAKTTYQSENGEFLLRFEKETPGEYFENLDMITNLLAPRDIPNINKDLVEMLEENEITIEEKEVDSNSSHYTYGFASKVSTPFKNIGPEFPQIFELQIPDQISIEERTPLRIKHENKMFSSDHYLADLFDTELLAPYLTHVASWNSSTFDANADFDNDQLDILKQLPNKNYILTKSEYTQVFMGLVDILFGFCYDKRTTLNDSTVESNWTINKLSSTLSWFCVFGDVKQVIIACYRRAIIYPIFRNYDLCDKVKSDLVSLLRKGKKFIVKCLIEIHKMFNSSGDARYLLNQLYIKDYLVFIQKCRNEELKELSNNIANINISKADLGLELDELEAAAHIVQQEEILENKMALAMASMSLLPDKGSLNTKLIDSSEDSSTSDSDSSEWTDDSSELDSDDEKL